MSYRAVKKLGQDPYHVRVIQKLEELAKDRIVLLSLGFVSLFISMQLTFWIIFLGHKVQFCPGEYVSGQSNRMCTNEVMFFWRHPYIVRRPGCALLFCITNYFKNTGVKG